MILVLTSKSSLIRLVQTIVVQQVHTSSGTRSRKWGDLPLLLKSTEIRAYSSSKMEKEHGTKKYKIGLDNNISKDMNCKQCLKTTLTSCFMIIS